MTRAALPIAFAACILLVDAMTNTSFAVLFVVFGLGAWFLLTFGDET